MIRRFLLEHGIADPGIAGEQQVPLGLDQRPLAVHLLVQLGLGQQPGAVERRLPQRLDGTPSSPVVVGGRGVTRQHPRGVLPVELGLDVCGHIDVVHDETFEVATEVDVAPIAVDDLQTADLAIADLEAGKVAQVDAGTTELVTLGVLSSHRSSVSARPARYKWGTEFRGLHQMQPWWVKRCEGVPRPSVDGADPRLGNPLRRPH